MNQVENGVVGTWTYTPRIPYRHQELVEDYVNHLSLSCGPSVLMKYRTACRHFVVWLDSSEIPPHNINQGVVKRFLEHKCSCHGYTQTAMRGRHYLGHVSRFVRFLESRGVVSTPGVSGDIPALIPEFEQLLRNRNLGASRRHLLMNEVEHFASWIHLQRIPWSEISGLVIKRFMNHKCVCPLSRRRGALAASGRARRRRTACMFLSFLYRNEHLPQPNPDTARFLTESGYESRTGPTPPTDVEILIGEYSTWLFGQLGSAETTVEQYTRTIRRCLHSIGADPTTYTPRKIRDYILGLRSETTSYMVEQAAKVLRSFLRFLSFHGRIPQHYVNAAPFVWTKPKDRRLPRYTSPDKIERIIASCPRRTSLQTRDRAIILLLARLGLRSSDIVSLRFDSIDWDNATLSVRGKTRKPALLPLPQDVGDALLDYIETARPLIADQRVFLTGNPPHRPFSDSKAINRVVKLAIERSGIDGIPSGTHMFRHSLATSMLRSGSEIEAVGAILRHKSPAVTRGYAKVNLPMLLSVAQPWPGDSPC